MYRIFLVLALMAALAGPARAEPLLKIINFTADWCPNCQILNPRIDEAMDGISPDIVRRVDLDLTEAGRGAPMDRSARAVNTAKRLAEAHRVSSLWNRYGGVTGIAVIVASDTGEPISCLMRPMTAGKIKSRLKLARRLVENTAPAQRRYQELGCPAVR